MSSTMTVYQTTQGSLTGVEPAFDVCENVKAAIPVIIDALIFDIARNKSTTEYERSLTVPSLVGLLNQWPDCCVRNVGVLANCSENCLRSVDNGVNETSAFQVIQVIARIAMILVYVLTGFYASMQAHDSHGSLRYIKHGEPNSTNNTLFGAMVFYDATVYMAAIAPYFWAVFLDPPHKPSTIALALLLQTLGPLSRYVLIVLGKATFKAFPDAQSTDMGIVSSKLRSTAEALNEVTAKLLLELEGGEPQSFTRWAPLPEFFILSGILSFNENNERSRLLDEQEEFLRTVENLTSELDEISRYYATV